MQFFAKEQKVREAIEPMMPEAVGMMVPWEPPRCFFGRFPRGDIYELLFLGKGNIFKARIFFSLTSIFFREWTSLVMMWKKWNGRFGIFPKRFSWLGEVRRHRSPLQCLLSGSHG